MLPKPFRRCELRLQRHGAQRHAAAAAARRAGAERDQQRASGRGRQGLCRQIFPGLVEGRDPGDGRQSSRPPSRAASRRSTGWRRRPRQEALKKVADIVVGVGYPDTWRDYSGAADRRRQRLRQLRRTRACAEYQHQIAKIGKPMDRHEWWMPPQLVNAVNLPVQNALNFPAAILVKPFFDPKADAGVQLWRDRRGDRPRDQPQLRQPAAPCSMPPARLRNWWTPADFKRFQAGGDAARDAVSTPTRRFPGLHVNGKLTLGENIADVAGLGGRLRAYHASLGGKPAPVIDGFTGDQRFFLAFAQAWATKMRDEALRQRVADRRPRARPVPRADGAQHRRLVPGVQRAAGPEAVPRARKRVKIWG